MSFCVFFEDAKSELIQFEDEKGNKTQMNMNLQSMINEVEIQRKEAQTMMLKCNRQEQALQKDDSREIVFNSATAVGFQEIFGKTAVSMLDSNAVHLAFDCAGVVEDKFFISHGKFREGKTSYRITSSWGFKVYF